MPSRSIRIAIVGQSPCEGCGAWCCRQNGHDYAAILEPDELPRFRPFAATAVFAPPSADPHAPARTEYVLPYVAGRCQFLGDDNLCTIYDARPRACRAFQCIDHFHAQGHGRHGPFLIRNPDALRQLEASQRTGE